MLNERFQKLYPEAFFVDVNDPTGLSGYLADIRFLRNGEKISNLEKAGNGETDLVLRAYTDDRVFVIKQSRPWIEKHSNINAPCERALMEGEYYKLLSPHHQLQQYHPMLLGVDARSYLLILENLEINCDYTHIYQKGHELKMDEAKALVDYLILLHTNFNSSTIYERIYNREMRKVNFEKMFIAPFSKAQLRSDTWQGELKDTIKPLLNDTQLIDAIKYLGRLYESDGNYLLHGDFCPANWLRVKSGIKVIDPEFCFFGHVEYDLGILLAHLLLSQQPVAIIRQVFNQYAEYAEFDKYLALNFAGVEMLRHLVNPKQLSLDLTMNEKSKLIKDARKMLLHPEEITIKFYT